MQSGNILDDKDEVKGPDIVSKTSSCYNIILKLI